MSRPARTRQRRDHLRPVELLAIAAGCGLFAGAVTLLALRELLLAGEIAVGVFVLALVGLAMFDLAISPRLEPGEGEGPEGAGARGATPDATAPQDATPDADSAERRSGGAD
ncbi:MAG: hypothetical protein J0G30_03215 [Actinomycetales bacterium]|nr:hypothetical protein [Actinomycetales bacterium]